MPPAKKTATTARRPRPRPSAEPDRERVEPLILLKRSRASAPPPEKVLLFAIQYDDGTADREFWVPKRAMASLALRYMDTVRREGDNAAVSWALEEVLGAEAYAELMADEQLEDDELAAIFQLVQNAIMGATRDPKGKRR